MDKKYLLLGLMAILILPAMVHAVDVSTCGNYMTNNAIYNMTGDVIDFTGNECMNISGRNVVFDCGGHTIDGTNGLGGAGGDIIIGMNISFADNIVVRRCNVQSFPTGILFSNSNGTLEKINITDTGTNSGLRISKSTTPPSGSGASIFRNITSIFSGGSGITCTSFGCGNSTFENIEIHSCKGAQFNINSPSGDLNLSIKSLYIRNNTVAASEITTSSTTKGVTIQNFTVFGSTILTVGGSNMTFKDFVYNTTLATEPGGAFGMLISGSNSLFINGNITANLADVKAGIKVNTGIKNITFVNMSITEAYSGLPVFDNTALYYWGWHFWVYANDTFGSAIQDVNISVYNSTNNLQWWVLTNSSGLLGTDAHVIDYMNFSTEGTVSNLSYYSNYTIYANKSGFINQSFILNISVNHNTAIKNMTLEEIITPSITFITPTFANNTNTSNATIFINISTNSSKTDICLVEICNATGCINQSMTKQSGILYGRDVCSIAFTQSLDKSISFGVFANNTLGEGFFSVLNITIDRTLPKQILNSPANSSNITNQWYMLNLTINDTWIDRVWFQNSSGNFTITNTSCLTIDRCYYYWNTTGWANGSQVIRIWANDSANNQNFTLYRFYQDKDTPYFWDINPAIGGTTLYTGTTQVHQFQALFNDTFRNVTMNVSMSLNGLNYSALTSIGYRYTVTLTGLPVGDYDFYWCGYDYAGNMNCTQTYTYSIFSSGGSNPPSGGGGGGAPLLVCGDGICSATIGENNQTCPTDCKTTQFQQLPYTIGDGKCEIVKGETISTSPEDCQIGIDLSENRVALIALVVIVIGVLYGLSQSKKKKKKSGVLSLS